MHKYHVDTFVPPAAGCGKTDMGWDQTRCKQFSEFLNGYARQGWRLQSCEYRSVVVKGCAASKAITLVCIFEAQSPQ
jgi:hypothetical protein